MNIFRKISGFRLNTACEASAAFALVLFWCIQKEIGQFSIIFHPWTLDSTTDSAAHWYSQQNSQILAFPRNAHLLNGQAEAAAAYYLATKSLVYGFYPFFWGSYSQSLDLLVKIQSFGGSRIPNL